jgi:hypothetical protein
LEFRTDVHSDPFSFGTPPPITTLLDFLAHRHYDSSVGTGIRYSIAVIAIAVLAWPGPARCQESTSAPTAKARAHFKAGLSYVDDPDGPRYEEAYREFKAAYAESPSWKILGNLGTCAFYLERDGEAIEAYEKFLAKGGDSISEEQRKQVEKDLATLKTSVVRLELTVEPAGATITDRRIPAKGTAVVNTYSAGSESLELGIHPGHHRMTVTAPGHKSAVWQFEAKPGAQLSRGFRLKRETKAPAPAGKAPTQLVVPSGEPQQRQMTYVYVALAGTGALLAGSAVTGALALSKESDYDAANGVDRTKAESLRKETQQLDIIADVLLGASVLGAAGTAYLYFSRDEGPEQAPGRQTAVKFQGGVAPNGGWVGVNGRF